MNRIIAAGHIDFAERKELTLPEGMTIDMAVQFALGDVSERVLSRTRVSLCTPHGSVLVDRACWSCVRPKQGVTIVIRVIAGKDALKTVLSIAITAAAVTLGGAWGPTVAGWLGVSEAVGVAITTTVLSVVGGLLLNALIPPIRPDTSRRNTYTVQGWRNELRPDGAVPVLFGRMRVAPPFAAAPYTEVNGAEQYIRSIFCVGEGPIDIDDIRIGETSIGDYSDVEVEVFNGLPDDLPSQIYPRQVFEEQIGAELTRPLPRDTAGEVISDEPSIETPVVRSTGADAKWARVILAWPSGLVRYDDNGQKAMHTVEVRIEQRQINADEWQPVKTLTIARAKAEGFFRQYKWQLPSRGRWQVRCTMMTDETEDSKIQQRVNWASLQTIRPEYPLAYPRPLALIAVRIKATHQLQGQLDSLNCLASRLMLSWDSETGQWVERFSENPGDAYRAALQSEALPTPAADIELNLVQIEDWAEWCFANNLTFNRYYTEDNLTLAEVLTEITGAGRSTPRHDGSQWSVVTDRPTDADPVIAEINPRNSWGSSWARSYGTPPAGFVVKFPDAENDYKPTQRIIPWPDHEGPLDPLETLPLPGKVYADEVFIEARRRQLEVKHRPNKKQVTQDGRVSVVQRGDTVIHIDDALDSVTLTARARKVNGDTVMLDTALESANLSGLAIQWRVISSDDPIGIARVAAVTVLNEQLVRIDAEGPYPEDGSIVSIGSMTRLTERRIVRGVEQTDDGCRIIHTLPAGLDIDTELAATVVPEWSPRVGAEIDDNLLQPSAPRFVSVTSGKKTTGDANQIDVLVEAGSGIVETSEIRVKHRLAGTTSWAQVDIEVAEGGCSISDYLAGDEVELTARGRSETDQWGPDAPILSITVGQGDADIPSAIDDDEIEISEKLGGVLVEVGLAGDEGAATLRIYRSQSAILDREADLAGEIVVTTDPQTYSFALGDTTRIDLTPASWTLGDGWSEGTNVFTHIAGAAGDLSSAFEATSGKYYRISGRLSGVTAGSLAPQFQNGSLREGVAVGADGPFADRIQAVTGNDTLAFAASADFNGTLDRIVVYRETKACLDQGEHFIWIEAVNADGSAGPASGPHSFNIV